MPTIMAVMNLATLCRTSPTRFLHQEHHATKTDLIQGINTPTTEGTDHIPIMIPDIGDIQQVTVPPSTHCNRSSSFRRHTSHSSSSHHSSFHCPSADGCSHCPSCHNTNRLPSPTDITHATSQTEASLPPATPTVQHRKFSPEKPNNAQDPQPPINPPFKDCHCPVLPFRFSLRFRHWFWSFKLLDPSPSSDKDEWGGHSSNHYTIWLVLDCLTVMVHAGKRFKVVIDSGAALSLTCTNIHNMIEDPYKTKIIPTALHLKIAEGSSMSSLGKAIYTFALLTLSISIPSSYVTDILFGIDIQKRYSLSYGWDSDKQLFIQREGLFNLHQELWTAT